MNYNNECEQKKCKYYIEWVFTDNDDQTWLCISCGLQGQSYEITKIAENCPFKDIKNIL